MEFEKTSKVVGPWRGMRGGKFGTQVNSGSGGSAPLRKRRPRGRQPSVRSDFSRSRRPIPLSGAAPSSSCANAGCGGGERGRPGREQAPREWGEVRWGWGWGRGGGDRERETGAPARPGEGSGGGEGCRYRGAERPALTSRARPRPGGEGRPRPLPSPYSLTSPAPGHPGIKKRF